MYTSCYLTIFILAFIKIGLEKFKFFSLFYNQIRLFAVGSTCEHQIVHLIWISSFISLLITYSRMAFYKDTHNISSAIQSSVLM